MLPRVSFPFALLPKAVCPLSLVLIQCGAGRSSRSSYLQDHSYYRLGGKWVFPGSGRFQHDVVTAESPPLRRGASFTGLTARIKYPYISTQKDGKVYFKWSRKRVEISLKKINKYRKIINLTSH